MTPEQFEALAVWLRAAVAKASRSGPPFAFEDAEQAAREAFLGKTHEQPRG